MVHLYLHVYAIYLNLVLNYLKDEHSAKIGTSLDESEWSMKSLGRTIPQQQNCSDCGMFTCTFATYATDTLVRGSGNGGRHGIPFEFGQQDMPYMRRRLALDMPYTRRRLALDILQQHLSVGKKKKTERHTNMCSIGII